MLENIILIEWKQKLLSDNISSDEFDRFLSSQAYMAYPDEKALIEHKDIVKKILHNQKDYIAQDLAVNLFTDDFLYTHTQAILYNNMNLLIVPFPHHYILGLVFDGQSNPLDYRNELIRLLQDYVFDKFFKNRNGKQKSTLLLTLFIDLRKYGEELTSYQEPKNKIQIYGNTPLVKVFVYGLDFAGKSSLMRLLATGKFEHDYFPPTKKFRITNVKLDSNVKLVCWDMPGQKIFRKDWLRGAQASNILLFVLDSADEARYEEAKREFWNMVEMYILHDLPVLFLVNKIDLVQGNPDKEHIRQEFELDKLDREYSIIFSSLPERIGIEKLIQWMENQVDQLMLINGIEKPDN